MAFFVVVVMPKIKEAMSVLFMNFPSEIFCVVN